jgi:hypothetical protein
MKKFLVLAGLAVGAASFAMADSACTSDIGDYFVYSTAFTGSSTLTEGTSNTPPSNSLITGCTVSGYDFSNFQVVANGGENGSAYGLGVGGTTTATTLAFFQTVQTVSQDVELTFTITSGVTTMQLQVGPGGTVSEVLCSVAETGTGTCGGETLGVIPTTGPAATSSQISVIQAAEDFVFKDVGAVSEFGQTVAPEPMTMSLMGAGLLGLGFIGRKLRK